MLTNGGANQNNEVTWVEDSDWSYGSGVLGVAAPLWYVASGQIIEADIAFNGLHHQWTTGEPINAVDVKSVVLHEVGHWFGIQHYLLKDFGPGSSQRWPRLGSAGQTETRTLEERIFVRFVFSTGTRVVPRTRIAPTWLEITEAMRLLPVNTTATPGPAHWAMVEETRRREAVFLIPVQGTAVDPHLQGVIAMRPVFNSTIAVRIIRMSASRIRQRGGTDPTEGGESDPTEGGESDPTEGGESDPTEGGESLTRRRAVRAIRQKVGKRPDGGAVRAIRQKVGEATRRRVVRAIRQKVGKATRRRAGMGSKPNRKVLQLRRFEL